MGVESIGEAGDDPIAAKILRILRSEADQFATCRVDVLALSDLADCAPSAVEKALRRLAAAGRLEEAGVQFMRRVRICHEWPFKGTGG